VSEQRSVWRIGELAAATGLTVRTLHHYDRIGLLSPSHRGAGGRRLYTDADAVRLYQVVALRGLGLRLEQIRECLTTEPDPRAVVAEQLAHLTAQLAAGQRLHTRLTGLLAELDRHQRPATAQLLDLVQRTTEVDRLVTRYLDADQVARLGRRHAELGERATAIVQVQLPALYQRAMAEYRKGTAATDPVVRGIAADIDLLGAVLADGTPPQSHGVRRMWAERGEQIHPGHDIPWAGLVAYLDAARADTTGATDG
jgi:DNA-binding transcriptional MerR regulator